MSTSRPFAYNPGSQISGTLQFGSVAVGTPTSRVTGDPRWFNGPDEDLVMLLQYLSQTESTSL